MQYSHLPHIHLPNHYQFITFRTHDSVDSYVKKLQLQYKETRQKQYAIDQYLDHSPRGAYLKGEVLMLLNEYLKQNHDLYELVAFSVMPNHVHLLLKPLQELAVMMQCIKGKSAYLINQKLGRKGKFWANEYYDKLVRDEAHFNTVYRYIQNNPVSLDEPDNSFPRFFGIYE